MADFIDRLELFKQGVAVDLRTELVRSAPADTGRLKGSIEVVVVGDELVIKMVPYALYVEFGTAPHKIRPRTKKALHWKTGEPGTGGRKDVFAKEVQHPGTKPQPFIRNTFYHKLKPIIMVNAERWVPEIAEELEVSFT